MDAERRAGREVEGVKDRATEQPPAAVPEEAKQAGEIHARWAWVEPTVWTERMLAALEQGVKGGKWFSLMDKVLTIDAGPTPILPSRGSSPWPQPMQRPADPLAGEPPTGEPYAGNLLVRFGGRGKLALLPTPIMGGAAGKPRRAAWMPAPRLRGGGL